jgi:hypothetical protein
VVCERVHVCMCVACVNVCECVWCMAVRVLGIYTIKHIHMSRIDPIQLDGDPCGGTVGWCRPHIHTTKKQLKNRTHVHMHTRIPGNIKHTHTHTHTHRLIQFNWTGILVVALWAGVDLIYTPLRNN